MEAIEAFFRDQQNVFIATGVTIALAVLSYFVFKRILVRALTFTAEKTKTSWDDALVEQGVFNHLPYIAPAAVIYLGAATLPGLAAATVQRIATAYIAANVVILIDRFLNSVLVIYRELPISQKRPIKGYVQVVKIVVYIIGALVTISLLLNQSPWTFLGGIGALTAVLMLIFRDTILSFVASIQIQGNDMVRVGDWVEMPKFGADGTVVEMALNTVKVQNFDKTIVTIPTYKLVEDSFKNWRGMSESGGRRIKRSLLIDQSSVSFLDKARLQRLQQIDVLRDYLDAKSEELAQYHAEHDIDTSELLNGRRMTNLGTFRAYVVAYLKHHPHIREDMTFLVRLKDPTAEGIPLQLYVFTDTVAWIEYEDIQSDVFDHLLAALPEFGLRVYQQPSCHDVVLPDPLRLEMKQQESE